MSGNAKLSVHDLKVSFDSYRGDVPAVRGISFDVQSGEIFGLVGESGSGKSVTAMAILRMIRPPGRIAGGSIRLDGQDLLALNQGDMGKMRGRRIGLICQDPGSSLNPVFTVERQMMILARAHLGGTKKEMRGRALAMLEAVGLKEPQRVLAAYPHQLSGGMQQRVMIAMALTNGADFLIADEPTTALDVTIQAQILDLLASLREQENLTILFITHDLGVVAELCDRVAVARLGEIVETGSTEEILTRPSHPYTQALLANLPQFLDFDANASQVER